MAWTAPMTAADDAVYTHTEFNTNVRDNLNFLKANTSLGDSVELTIATGAVTKTKSYHSIDTESDAASDELDTISGGSEGEIIYIRAENAARTVILKDGTTGDDNLDLGGHDIYLTDTDQYVSLINDGTNWCLLSTDNKVVEFMANAFQYPTPATAWGPELNGAGCPASQTTVNCWLPLNFLKIGDQVISYKLVGDATETNALTLDCKLVRINKADPITTSDVAGGGITQIDAGGNFDSEATLTAAEVMATDKQYCLEILATTGVSDTITVMGAEIKVVRLC